ncbi:MAG: thioredoxin family protein [candidate division Zixibacteria bacterium]|nr:thioredoxin family protein [candidate division Zixibacteria bacterium]
MKTRTIEIFTVGCPVCDEAVKQVESLACPSCDIRILDLRNEKEAQARAQQYGVKRVPAVAVNGKLADCCQEGIDAVVLRGLGLGVKL